MLEHHARACTGIDACAYATHERTNARTDVDGLLNAVLSPFVSRAGGLKESSTGSGHSAARADLLTVEPKLTSTGCACPSIGAGSRRGYLQNGNAQGFAGAPLTHEHVVSCTNSATRRTETAFVAVPRHRFVEAACSPVARWHGESDGSNPLRPPADIPAASRCRGRLSLAANSTGGSTKPTSVVALASRACRQFGLAWARADARQWRTA